jgi:hypothetical protein
MDPETDSSPKVGTLEGRYANNFAVGYNACEFIFDFGQRFTENDQAELQTRIITNPVYAKAFLKTLQDTLETFETTYGCISESE